MKNLQNIHCRIRVIVKCIHLFIFLFLEPVFLGIYVRSDNLDENCNSTLHVIKERLDDYDNILHYII